jgi:hypothetical protein
VVAPEHAKAKIIEVEEFHVGLRGGMMEALWYPCAAGK